jgi:hypothetical protein
MDDGDTKETIGPSHVAVLGTLAEFHQDPLPYDLAALVDLVAEINPDLLCLDISMEQWQTQDFGSLTPEYGQALLPLAAQTDIVVVPIGGDEAMLRATADGWRGALIRLIRRLLAGIQSGAPGPDAINQGWRHEVGNVLYWLARRLAGRQVVHAYHERIAQLTKAVQRVVEENPGNRILVVTNIQFCHHIRPRLRQQANTVVKAVDDL